MKVSDTGEWFVFGDWNGNITAPDSINWKATTAILEKWAPKLSQLLRHIKLSQAQFYFSKDKLRWFSVNRLKAL